MTGLAQYYSYRRRPLTQEFTYAGSGVNRKLRAESKKALQVLKKTYRLSVYGKIIRLPFGNIFPLGRGSYLDLQIEGVGTKVLVAQLAQKYDTIGIDGVAMAVNDVIRSGARPLAIADNIHAQASEPSLVKQWIEGLAKGAIEAECIVPGGEIGDVAELTKGFVEGKGFDMIVAAVGKVDKEKIITGKNIKPGDPIIGLRSSGLHSNGMSLARRILFKQWGGKYDPQDVPDGLKREIIWDVLEPTKIYVKPLLKVAENVQLKAAVHITGDAYLKFDRLSKFSKHIGFEFSNFNPHPIFELIQKTALEIGGMITDEEMLKTFNMGWGFAIVVNKTDADEAMDALEKSGTETQQIGRVTGSERIEIIYKNKKIVLK
ncbi:MAG: phosphoribosylformylglycinamidine cyclo-ligase [Candidatus Bathyarchaeia archaeon]|jgi:phosphoribosylformylglycinamidine cyclo-ligase